MSYDLARANSAAFYAVSELARLLRDAIDREQKIVVNFRRLNGGAEEPTGCRIMVEINQSESAITG
jgi:hypothetical protein